MEDEKIVDLYWQRSQQAIDESNTKYGSYCYAIAYRILSAREDAEECVNDTWLRAWDAMPPHRPSRLDTFLGKLTRNLSLDRWKWLHAQKRGLGQAELALGELENCLAAPSSPEDSLDARSLTESLNRFLESLPQDKRILFLQRYWYLCPISDIAVRFGMRENTVSSTLFRLRQQLRLQLEKEGFIV